MVFDEAFRPRELLLAEEPLGGLPARSRTGGGPEPAILCRDNLLRSVAAWLREWPVHAPAMPAPM